MVIRSADNRADHGMQRAAAARNDDKRGAGGGGGNTCDLFPFRRCRSADRNATKCARAPRSAWVTGRERGRRFRGSFHGLPHWLKLSYKQGHKREKLQAKRSNLKASSMELGYTYVYKKTFELLVDTTRFSIYSLYRRSWAKISFTDGEAYA